MYVWMSYFECVLELQIIMIVLFWLQVKIFGYAIAYVMHNRV